MKKYPSTIENFIEQIGSERILYGTDYPAFNHAFSIISVLRATGSEIEMQNIFSLNVKRLLKI